MLKIVADFPVIGKKKLVYALIFNAKLAPSENSKSDQISNRWKLNNPNCL